MIIGQEGPLTAAESELLHNNKNSEIIRIYRKQLSYIYAQRSALLVQQAQLGDLQVKQGELRGLALAWNVPFQLGLAIEQQELKVKKTS